MKKFGTPIGAAPGMRQREGRVVERRRCRRSRARAPCRRAFFLAWRLSSRDELLAVEVAGLELLVARRLRRGAWPGSEPPWLRLGAPGFSLPSGRRRRLGLRLGAGDGRARRGRSARAAACRSASARSIGPLSMICAIAPVMPGIDDLRGGRAGRDVDGLGDALARDEDDRDGVQLGRGWERSDAEANRGHDHRDDPFRLFISSTRPPARCYASSRAFPRRGCDSSTRPRDVGHATEWLQAFAIRERLTARYLAAYCSYW